MKIILAMNKHILICAIHWFEHCSQSVSFRVLSKFTQKLLFKFHKKRSLKEISDSKMNHLTHYTSRAITFILQA